MGSEGEREAESGLNSAVVVVADADEPEEVLTEELPATDGSDDLSTGGFRNDRTSRASLAPTGRCVAQDLRKQLVSRVRSVHRAKGEAVDVVEGDARRAADERVREIRVNVEVAEALAGDQ